MAITTNVHGVKAEELTVRFVQYSDFGVVRISTGDFEVTFFAQGESASTDLRLALHTAVENAETRIR